jgi:hypothetical protein
LNWLIIGFWGGLLGHDELSVNKYFVGKINNFEIG